MADPKPEPAPIWPRRFGYIARCEQPDYDCGEIVVIGKRPLAAPACPACGRAMKVYCTPRQASRKAA